MNDGYELEYTWTIEYVKSQNFVKVVAENDFSVEGHTEMIADLVSRDFWEPGANLFIDDRKVDFKGIKIDSVKEVSRGFSDFEKELGDGKTAILMNSLSDYTRGRQFELLTDDKVSTDIKVFRDEQEALSWLNS